MREVTPAYQRGDRVELHGEVFEVSSHQREGMPGSWLRVETEKLFWPMDLEACCGRWCTEGRRVGQSSPQELCVARKLVCPCIAALGDDLFRRDSLQKVNKMALHDHCIGGLEHNLFTIKLGENSKKRHGGA
jgi:hypothetical protein